MKVFRVDSDVNRYQWLMPDVPDTKILEYTTFDCSSRLEKWRSPNVYLNDPLSEVGDFLYYDPGVLVASPFAQRKVRHFFEESGEVLPLWFEGDQYALLNITECIRALEESKTEWLRARDGSKVEIRRYSFNPDRFTDSSLFKIPEACGGNVLTWEKDKSPEREFKSFVEENGLSGLLFVELWDSEREILK